VIVIVSKRVLLRVAIALFSVSLFAAADLREAKSENWPGWRGPGGNGLSHETGLPTHWSREKGVLWKTPLLGSGISSPIIWEDRVFVTASDGPDRDNLHVICLERDNGKSLWHQQLWGTSPTRYHGTKSSMASPAPVTDGKFVFAFFGTGDVFCLDFDGELIWQRSLASEYGAFENRFAASSSPLVYDQTVILQCDHYGDSDLIALDKTTGADVWKIDRPESWLSWASPQLVPVENTDRFELVVSGSHKLDAFNPTNGEKLWTVQGMCRECIPSPVFGNGLVYAVSGPKGPTFAVRPGGRGDVTGSRVAWSTTRGAPFVPSAIVVGERYYLVDDRGIATCLDANTGKVRWGKRLSGQYTASPVAADGKVFFCDESGTTVVVASDTDRFQEIARNELNEPIFASPAISDGKLFLRTAKHLFCIAGSN
jgi:outer membrane protein assembly factor BamB